MLMKWIHKDEGGSIVLEAALVMPLFLAFIITLINIIHLSVSDAALRHAVSETTKQAAAHMYPVELLWKEAANTQTGESLLSYVARLKSARESLLQAEKFIDHYAYLIPDSLLEVLVSEKRIREQAENGMEEQASLVLNKLFKPIVLVYVDDNRFQRKMLRPSALSVVKVTLPNLENKEKAFFGIEAQYTIKLFIPFFEREVVLRKKSYERVWIGN